MDSIKDLLNARNESLPFEVSAIKQYIMDHFQAESLVVMQPQHIVIAVPSAALAGTLRLHLPKIQAAAQTDKRLILRIGR